MKRWVWGYGVLLLAACGGGGRSGAATSPSPVGAARGIPPAQVDSLWADAQAAFRHGKWSSAAKKLERLNLAFAPGDPRIPQARFFLGEAYLARGEHLQAAREFRRVADEIPNHALAAEALLRAGDTYADLWRRPELDPSYGQTALATYQEVLSRYPDDKAAQRAQIRIADLQERFAYKGYRSALYYYRLKAYDSAILYLKDVVATYPKASVAPAAVTKLIQSYRKLGYKEDVQETCGYLRRFHPNADADEVCPKDSAGAT